MTAAGPRDEGIRRPRLERTGAVEFKTTGDIISFAIRREEESIRDYGEMKSQAPPGGLRVMLGELEAEEINHKKLLEDMKISDYLVAETPGSEMSLQDLLILAAKKEEKAAALYGDLAGKAGRPEHRRLFKFLRSQEKAHKLRLESEYETFLLEEN
ncbi:MAG TPA: ferritin family protein [Candidatus Aminicenantes bacterium]|nr:ferritin family protein [Candidatus Aminicenantes bacterium]